MRKPLNAINPHQGPTHTSYKISIKYTSGENGDLNSFAIFSNGGHLEFSTRLNFIILKPWSLIMLHMKFMDSVVEENKSFEWTLSGLKCNDSRKFC